MSDQQHLFPPVQTAQLAPQATYPPTSRSQYEAVTPHSAVSSFNLPLIADTSLSTPVSMSIESPARYSHKQVFGPISGTVDPQKMRIVQNHGLPIFNNSSRTASWQDEAATIQPQLSLQTSTDDMPAMSFYMQDSPQTQCPPTPHFGAFGVSFSSVNSTPPSAHPAPQNSMPIVSYVQAPILTQPTPQAIRERHGKRSYNDEEYKHSQHIQQTLQQSYGPPLHVPLPSQVQTPQPDTSPRIPPQLVHQAYLQQFQSQLQQQYPYQNMHPQHSSQFAKVESTPPPSARIPSSITSFGQHDTVPNITRTPSTSMGHKRRKTNPSPPRRQSSPIQRQRAQSSSKSAAKSAQPKDQTSDLVSQISIDPKLLKASTTEAKLTDDDKLLKSLRENATGGLSRVPWKVTEAEFNHQAKTPGLNVAALEMRYKRLNEKIRPWTEDQIRALITVRLANPMAEWERIAVKMHKDHGIKPKWSKSACRKKWKEMFPDSEDENEDAVEVGTPMDEGSDGTGSHNARSRVGSSLGLGLDFGGQQMRHSTDVFGVQHHAGFPHAAWEQRS